MKKPVRVLISILFWIALWQAAAMVIGEELLFPSPVSTMRELIALMKNAEFYKNIGTTFLRILAGALAAGILGLLLGILSGLFAPVSDLFSPLMTVIRSTPVASFIVLLVLWMSRSKVPIIIAGLMVLPVFYSNAKKGIEETDPKLLRMADAFRMPLIGKITHIYLPSTVPYLSSAAASSFGLAWKAGVAAEVIVLPVISIGRQLYYSSNNLETARMFAWTLAVILLSLAMDKVMAILFNGRKELKNIPAYSTEEHGNDEV